MTKIHPDKWLIFPLEVVEREIDGKLLICAEAMARGWGCIMGTDKEIIKAINALPPGAIILKSALLHELPYLQSLKRKGHRVICLDEEGLVQNNIEYMVTVRSTAETVEALDAFFFWGKVQCDAYKETYKNQTDKLHVTSNPRIDLWEKEKYHALCADIVADIQNTYGDYFIIPTSFGSYNHFMGKEGAMDVYKAGHFVTEDSVAFFEEYEEYAKNIYYGFIDIIEPLSKKFPNKSIIVRPHPSENRKPWDELAQRFDNVHVVFSGGVTPWLLGAEAVLHCGSTTAVEAHLLGKPVISYCRDYSDPKYALEVPAKISINITEAKDVLDILQKVADGEDVNALYPEIAEGHEWLKGWADGVDGPETAKQVMDAIENLDVQNVNYDPSQIKVGIQLNTKTIKSFIWYLLHFLDYIPFIERILPFKIKFGVKSYRYGKNKTNDINTEEVHRILNKLKEIDGRGDFEISTLRKNIIAITPK